MSAVTAPLPPLRRIAASLVVGLVVAVTVHLGTVLIHFAANGSVADNLQPISMFFLPASLILFVLVALAWFLGAHRSWFIALPAALVAGIIAALLGMAFGVLTAGAVWTPEIVGLIGASLIGNNLIFVVLAALVGTTIGRRVWSGLTSSSQVPRMVALVRQPASRLAEGELTHLERTEIDADLADEQWENYVEALEANGFETVEVPVADDLPDSVFIEDAVVIFGDTAVIASPGAESRRGETDAVRAVATELGLAVTGIELPGTLDGGDVLKVGTTVYVGRGGRTNAEGIRQLRAIIDPLGYTVVAVPVKKVLHLKSAVTALPDGTVIGYSKLVDNPGIFERFLAVPEPSGAAVLVLSADTVLMAASAPKSAALIADLGYRVITVDISEFEKLEGCVTCLSVRLR